MENNLELQTIISLLKRRWKFVCAMITFFIILAVIVHQLSTPKYEAKTDLFVNYRGTGQATLQSTDIEMSLRLIETYKSMLKSDRMLEKVLNSLNETTYTKQEIFDLVTIEAGNDSQIITIVAQEKTAQKAVQLVNTYATVFQEEVESLMNLKNITVLSEASETTGVKEVQLPPYLIYLIACLMGVMLSTLIIVVQEFYSGKLNTAKKIEGIFHLSNMGVIPLFKSKRQGNRTREEWKKILLAPTINESPLAEEFRRVRANVQHQMTQKSMQTILVTSSTSKEGKSLISGGLATVMAMDGKKTIFIDADLRAPMGNQIFDLPKRVGLTSVIAGQFTLHEVIQETDIPNLSFLGAGPLPTTPAEILSSEGMKQLIKKLKEQFDVIVIDTSPLHVADAVSLTTIADGCLYVIDSKNTKVGKVSEGLGLLEKVNAPIVGTILNKSSLVKGKIVLG